MNLFKGIAIFIGWLTGSLAGIMAISYACGYLVVRAQLNVLGLFGLFEYPKEHYLQEGAKFFVVVTVMLIHKLLPRLVLMFCVLVFVSIIVLLFLAVCFFFKRNCFLDRCGRFKSYILAIPKGWPWLWSSFLLLCFAFILVFCVLDYFNDFAAVLKVSNLLYGAPEKIGGGDDSRLVIVRWLLEGDIKRLQDYFFHLLKGELLAVLLLTVAWHTAAMFQQARFWLVSPFIIVFALYTIITPMAYGVLVRPTKYAVVSFNWKDEPIAVAPSGFYLLNKSDQEFVLWDREHKKVLCISKDLVWGAQVSEVRPLFYHRDKNK